MIDVDAQPSNRGSNSLVVPTGFPAPPAGYVFLCCPHVGPYPTFEQLQDRRMEWSPLFASGAWSPQWLCRQCCRTVGDPPSFPRVSCSRCGEQCTVFVTDFSSGDSGMWCPSCQLRTECVSPQSRLALQDCERPQPNWFTHGPLSTFGHLYGWGAVPISPPGSGSQSWLLCPLISLGLLDAEHARGVPAYSTGSRLPVPDQQRTYWMARDGYHPRFQSTFPVFDSSVCRRPRIAIFLGSRRSPPWFLPRRMLHSSRHLIAPRLGLRAVQFIPPPRPSSVSGCTRSRPLSQCVTGSIW